MNQSKPIEADKSSQELEEILAVFAANVDYLQGLLEDNVSAKKFTKEHVRVCEHAISAINSLTLKQVLEGRMVELDLLEQAMNHPATPERDWLYLYKLNRLEDLENRLDKLSAQKRFGDAR